MRGNKVVVALEVVIERLVALFSNNVHSPSAYSIGETSFEYEHRGDPLTIPNISGENCEVKRGEFAKTRYPTSKVEIRKERKK